VENLNQRVQFGRPLAQLQGLQFMVADMATAVDAARLMTWQAAAACDRGEDFTRLAAMAKVFATDTAMSVTTDAVQLFGGYGYIKEFPVERYMRDAKATQIYEGTNQIQRIVIARELLRAD
jgi:butyryl-CoA dehydrogenase